MRINNLSNFNFCAGKTRLYTDFDGTYFPFSQDSIRKEDENSVSSANKMYAGFRDFVAKAKEKFSILITTGRNKWEMFGALNDFKKSGVDINLPDGYIFSNGVEELKNVEKENLKNTLKPYLFTRKEEIKQLIQEIDDEITIIEPLANMRITGREDETLKALFRELKPQDRKKYVSLVSETSGMLELAFPPDIEIEPYVEKISAYYKKHKIPVDIEFYYSDSIRHVPCQEGSNAEPVYKKANTIFVRPAKDGIKADKLNKPKQEIREIIKNNSNDLVVVAGDDSNDFEMLNPLNYLDIFGVSIDENMPIEEILAQEEVLSAISKLPLVSIVTGENRCMGEILKIKEELDKKGIHKIFNAKNPSEEFLAKLKEGMLIYSGENTEYRDNLGVELLEEILNI
ncbi:MAG: hypothetical protein IJW73_09370 [Candidatus Gastranaerophilales bacterium]|nr:hypothetical protein [Candidatus Gastranaerophilales bacterium]